MKRALLFLIILALLVPAAVTKAEDPAPPSFSPLFPVEGGGFGLEEFSIGESGHRYKIKGTYTVATIPGSPTAGDVILVTDGDSACDVTTGGGSFAYYLQFNGSAWTCIGDGGGGGTDTAAIHDNQANEINGISQKGSALVDGDALVGENSASSWAKIKILMSEIWTYISSKISATYPNLDTDSTDDFDGAWSSLTGTPTTLAGYGITDAQADLDVPSQAEAEAGTATIERVWTALRIAQAIVALAPGGVDEIVYQADCSSITNGLCIDTDDGYLYYYNNSSVVQIYPGAGSGDVSAASNFGTDNVLIKSNGTSKGVQATGISVDDSDNITGVTTITAGEYISSAANGLHRGMYINTVPISATPTAGSGPAYYNGEHYVADGTDWNDYLLRYDHLGSNVFTFLGTPSLTNFLSALTGEGAYASTLLSFADAAALLTDIGLDNVDNTSDATKNSASVTLTNKTIDADDNTLQDIPYDINWAVMDPASGDAFFIHLNRAVTASNIYAYVDPADSSESVVVDIQECDSTGDNCATVLSSTITAANIPTAGTLSDTSWASGGNLKIVLGTVTGTVSSLSIYGLGKQTY